MSYASVRLDHRVLQMETLDNTAGCGHSLATQGQRNIGINSVCCGMTLKERICGLQRFRLAKIIARIKMDFASTSASCCCVGGIERLLLRLKGTDAGAF